MQIIWAWFRRRRRPHAQALELARAEGCEQGWRDCLGQLQPRLIEQQRALAQADQRQRIAVERAYASGFTEGQAFAVLGNAAWTQRPRGQPRES